MTSSDYFSLKRHFCHACCVLRTSVLSIAHTGAVETPRFTDGETGLSHLPEIAQLIRRGGRIHTHSQLLGSALTHCIVLPYRDLLST